MDNKIVSIRVTIRPAFMVEIVEDSTGKKWDGHYTLGRTAKEALSRWKRGLESLPGYTDTEIIFRADNPRLAQAVGWKEAIIDTSD